MSGVRSQETREAAPPMDVRFIGRMSVLAAVDGLRLVLDGMEYDIDHVRAALQEYARKADAGAGEIL